MRSQRRLHISLGIRPVWSESLLCAQWIAKAPRLLHADSEDSDQTGRMLRLIWALSWRTCHFVGFVMRQLSFSCSKPTKWTHAWPAKTGWSDLKGTCVPSKERLIRLEGNMRAQRRPADQTWRTHACPAKTGWLDLKGTCVPSEDRLIRPEEDLGP